MSSKNASRLLRPRVLRSTAQPSKVAFRNRDCPCSPYQIHNGIRLPIQRTFMSRRVQESNPYAQLDTMKSRQLRADSVANSKKRVKLAAMGLTMTLLMTFAITRTMPVTKADTARPQDKEKLQRSNVIVVKGEAIEEEARDLVETGTSSVPFFPRVLDFRDREDQDHKLVSYQLLGLGIRTVSFFGIQVYVVGMYVAVEDIAALQVAMVKRINPLASTLVAGEKGQLKEDLLDPTKSEKIWEHLLRDSRIRTIIRIVPTRNTDFNHLRDAFVRHITARSQGPKKAEYQDEEFGLAVASFKKLFGSGSLPKGRELLLARDSQGKLSAWHDNGKNGSQRLGEVLDERISRAVWLNYLAGKSVASESARRSIIDGVIECVERPIGTVATQVV